MMGKASSEGRLETTNFTFLELALNLKKQKTKFLIFTFAAHILTV